MDMRALVLAIVIMAAGSAWAAEPWDQAVRRLCSSLDQQDCWIKSGATLCDRDQLSCRNLDDHTPAVVIGKSGKRWNVKTTSGNGWVNERFMMLDGSKMR